jgi:RNA polymerase sigma-70 factor, ECF subfamily
LAKDHDQNSSARHAVASAAREHHGKLLAILIKELRDFQLAEDCLQDAIESALVHWQRNGTPQSSIAWLLQVARRKALDRLRRAKSFKEKSQEMMVLMDQDQDSNDGIEEGAIPDERLRLIFTCCHPALDPQTSVALSLRTLCGLTTQEIAKAFVVSEDTMAQRLVRAKQKIAKAGIRYEVPEGSDIPNRLNAVLSTIYLTFNEGYVATSGPSHLRVDLCEEAIRLARLIQNLCPDEPEAAGLLSLLLLTHARRNARSSADGAYIPLEEQDRAIWNHALIAEGSELLIATLKLDDIGPYQLQASINAIHAEAESHQNTNWKEIIQIYDRLYDLSENTVYLLNRAIAFSFLTNPTNGLRELDQISPELQSYQPYHAARADLLRRAQNYSEARVAYDQAITLSQNEVERTFLAQRRASLLS